MILLFGGAETLNFSFIIILKIIAKYRMTYDHKSKIVINSRNYSAFPVVICFFYDNLK